MKKWFDTLRCRSVMAGVVIITLILLAPAYCQLSGVTLLIQQSPPQGGKVVPSAGVYDFELNAEITLTAIPKAGYYFVQWLGDVVDPTAPTTVAYLNKPKVIIAVFQQTDYGTLLGGATVTPDIVSSVVPVGGGSSSGGGGGFSNNDPPKEPPPPDDPDDKDPPPWNPPDPPPVPEPATGLLLALGGLALLRKRAV